MALPHLYDMLCFFAASVQQAHVHLVQHGAGDGRAALAMQPCACADVHQVVPGASRVQVSRSLGASFCTTVG